MSSKNIKGLTIEIDGKTTGLEKALREVNKQSFNISKELKEVDKLLKFNPGNSELLAQKQKILGDQVNNTAEKLHKLKSAQAEVNAQFERGDISEGQYRGFRREIEETEGRLKSYKEQLKEVEKAKGDLALKVEELGGKFKAAGEKISDAGKKMTARVSAPIIGLGALAVKAGADFEAGMSEVAAISGASGEELESLTEKAKEMGSTTKFSATESADALKYMAMAGWDTEKMLGGISGIMSLAAASGEELGTVSDIVTDAMTAFGLEASEAAHFADILATASSSSNTNVAMMGETFKYAAPVAGALGFSVEDTALAIGLMANAGIKGSQAGTSLRAILSELTEGVTISGKAFGELDVATQNQDGTMRSLSEVMDDLRGGWDQLTEAEQAQNAEMIAGANGMSGFLAIMNSSDQDYKLLKDNINNATGSAEEMAAVMNDNLQGKLTLIKSQLEGIAIELSDILIPIIGKVVEKISGWIEWFSGLDDSSKKIILIILAVVAAIGPLLLIIGKIISIIGIVMQLSVILGPAIAAISGPIGIVIAAIAAAIAIGVALYKNWETIKEQASKLWEYLKRMFKGIGDAIMSPINNAVETLKNINLTEIGKNIIQGLMNGISSKISGVRDTIGNIGSTVIGGIKNKLKIHSPSEVTTEMGEYTGEGFAIGLKNSLGLVAKQTEALTGMPKSRSIPESVGSTMNHSGTIRIEGYNSKGEFEKVVDVVMDTLRREVRLA